MSEISATSMAESFMKLREYNTVENNALYKFASIRGDAEAPEADGIFESMLKSAMQTVDATAEEQITAQEQYIALATGKTDDILSVVLAQEKASVSLNFTTQVANKLIEAYKEIMRLQL